MLIEGELLPASTAPTVRKSWLLVFNCQAVGLAHSLRLLCPQIEVEYYDVHAFAHAAAEVQERLHAYERIVLASGMNDHLDLSLDDDPRVWRVPPVVFYGYHPDLCYVISEDGPVESPLGGYNSALAFAGYLRGLSVSETLGLYSSEVYGSMGYTRSWNTAKKELLDSYREHGFAMENAFVTWVRSGRFMHTPNHPTIQCLHGLAQVLLEKSGRTVMETQVLPHDNLAVGVNFPVYPEIATGLGLHGSYLFKRDGCYEFMGLEEFVDGSFRSYRGALNPAPHPAHRALIDQAISLVEARA